MDKTFTKLQTRGGRLTDQLRNRQKKQFNKFSSQVEHLDIQSGQLTGLNFTGVQIVIASTKHDLHTKYDPEARKALSS